MRPMLAQSGDRDQLPAYIEDDSYVLEQKLDGQRLVVRVQNEQGQPLKVEAFNRAGMPKQTMVNKTLLTCFEFFASEGTWIFDGELVGPTYHVFDMPEGGGGLVSLTTPLNERRTVLETLFGLWKPRADLVSLVHQAKTTEDKAALAAQAEADLCEGVMVKAAASRYSPSLRSAAWVKVKFTHDLDAIILDLGHGGKDNAVLALLDKAKQQVVEVGRASTIGKRPTPEIGQVWTVRYLYFTDADRRLYQPRLMRLRTDKAYEECTVEQLVTTSKHVIDRTRAER